MSDQLDDIGKFIAGGPYPESEPISGLVSRVLEQLAVAPMPVAYHKIAATLIRGQADRIAELEAENAELKAELLQWTDPQATKPVEGETVAKYQFKLVEDGANE